MFDLRRNFWNFGTVTFNPLREKIEIKIEIKI